jgi:hypothetical protein
MISSNSTMTNVEILFHELSNFYTSGTEIIFLTPFERMTKKMAKVNERLTFGERLYRMISGDN